jgi:hypothetical protein
LKVRNERSQTGSGFKWTHLGGNELLSSIPLHSQIHLRRALTVFAKRTSGQVDSFVSNPQLDSVFVAAHNVRSLITKSNAESHL